MYETGGDLDFQKRESVIELFRVPDPRRGSPGEVKNSSNGQQPRSPVKRSKVNLLSLPQTGNKYYDTLNEITKEEFRAHVQGKESPINTEDDPASLLYKTWDPWLAKKFHVNRFLSDRRGLGIGSAKQLHVDVETGYNDTWNASRIHRIDRRIERHQMVEAELTFHADEHDYVKPSILKIFDSKSPVVVDDSSIASEIEEVNYAHLFKKPRQKIPQWSNISIFLCCCAVVILLMSWRPHEHDSSVHSMFLSNYDSMLYGKLCVVPCLVKLDDELPIEVVAVKMIVEDIGEAIGINETSLTVGWEAITKSPDGVDETSGILGSLEVTAGAEAEFIGEYDIANMLYWGTSSHFHFYVIDGVQSNEANFALVVEVQQMSSLARHKIWLSAVLLVLVYVLIGLELCDRVLIALVGSLVALLLVSLVQSPPDMGLVMSWMDEATLSLLFGMMVIVAILSVTGVFEWFAVRLVYFSSTERSREVRDCNMFKLTVCMCIFSAIVSAFLDNVTTLLLVSPVSICLCNMLVGENSYKESSSDDENDSGGVAGKKGDSSVIMLELMDLELKNFSGVIDDTGEIGKSFSLLPSKEVEKLAIPLLIVNGVFGNIGGCMTLIGAIPNVIIGGRLSNYIGFTDFVINLAPAVIVMMPLVIIFLKWQFSESLAGTYPVRMDLLYERYKIKDKQLLVRGGTVTGFVILAFFLHPIHHRSSGWLALLGAMAMLSVGALKDVSKVLHHVEWDTLLFFGGLFILVAALSELGLIREIGSTISGIVKSTGPDARLAVACVTILWVSAVVSGFLSNIAFAATMAPVIKIVGEDPELNLPMAPLAWSLCFGTCLGGNLTLIGSAANLIAAGVAQHNGMHISFLSFFKVGGPVWVITNVIAMLWLLIVYVWI